MSEQITLQMSEIEAQQLEIVLTEFLGGLREGDKMYDILQPVRVRLVLL